MPDNLDQINVTTRRYIRSNPALVDNIYNQDALNYFLRKNLREDFSGGSTINENFIYASMIGGPYLKGKNFNVAQRQTEQQLRFDVKFTQVSVPLYQEDIQVLNKGDLAAVKLLRARIDEGYMSLGAFVSILTYLNGINANYTPNINGLAEALNDGTTAGWDGNTYTTYGGLTRATYAPSLTSAPTVIAGAIEYDTIDRQYMNAFYGSGNYEPNLMITTPIGFSYIKSKFQTQQRFQDTKLDVGVGFRGMSFNGATLVASRYAPGSYMTGPAGAGTADPVATTVLSEMSNGAVVAYPVGSLGNSGESLFILNARKPFLNYYVSNDSTFGGGFRDFIPSANNTILVGQVLLAHNLTLHPRYHRYLYGFSS
jgi:hypothetical protein